MPRTGGTAGKAVIKLIAGLIDADVDGLGVETAASFDVGGCSRAYRNEAPNELFDLLFTLE